MFLGDMHIDQFIEWGKVFRARIFKSIFKILTSLNIRANHITALRFLLIPLFIYLMPIDAHLAVVLIIIATVLDWFDGGLARFRKLESDRGKFWDVLVDHLVYVGGLFSLLLVGGFSVIYISYQLLIVPVLFLLATITASEKSKTDWIIHPYYRIIYLKPLALVVLILWAFASIDYLNIVLLILNISMTILALYYFFVLKNRWAK